MRLYQIWGMRVSKDIRGDQAVQKYMGDGSFSNYQILATHL
jgi:hypothetical protein